VHSYTRHKLKQDKFAETAQDAVHWASGHRKTVIWVTSAVLIVAGVTIGLLVWHNRQSDQANFALSKAMRTFATPLREEGAPVPTEGVPTYTTMAERGKESAKLFKDVADKYPYTKAGKIALYMAGAATLQAGDDASGEQQLKSLADSRDQDIASLSKLALANHYRAIGRQPDAAKLYKELADRPSNTVSKAEAQLELADMYMTTSPLDAANLYQQIQKENPPPSPAGSIAAAKLKAGK
jgi:predicted negative regulator of RcsB-dependent stress response